MRRFRFIVIAAVILLVLWEIGSAIFHHIPNNTVIKLTLEGNIAEEPIAPGSNLFNKQQNLTDLVLSLSKAATDPKVSGVIVEISPFEAGFAKIQELRNALQEVRQSGKWTAAYITGADTPEYLVASACQEIFMLPVGEVLLNGLHQDTPFLRGLFDKLGIKPEFQHIGDYKTFMNDLTEKKYTKAHKEMATWLIDNQYKQLVTMVATSRNLKDNEVTSLIDQGLFLGKKAVEAKLVDKLAYIDEMKEDLEKEHGGEFNEMSWGNYMARSRNPRVMLDKKVAIVYLDGAITEGESGYNLMVGKTLGSDTLSKVFKEIRDDPEIKAVVMRIDSPGGEASASEIIRHEALLTAQKVPIVISMSDVAASGGYWVTCFSPTIFADPGTITASIGVVGGKFVVRDLYEKRLGITHDSLSRGKVSTLQDALTSYSPEEKQLVKDTLDFTYDHFLSVVAESRKMKKEEVDAIGQGRVFMGEQAKEKKLVDELGGISEAIQAAKAKIGIPPEQKVLLEVFPKPKSPIEKLVDTLSQGTLTFELPWSTYVPLAYL